MTMFEHDGMFVQSFGGTMESQDGHIAGSLRVFEKDGDIIVDWTLLDDNFDSTNIPCAGKDSSSVVEWTQTPKERTLHGTEHQNSYEAEWDMVSTVSFKKRPFSNGDSPSPEPSQSKSSFRFSLICLKFIKLIKEDISCTYVFCLTNDALLPALQFHQDIAMQLFNCLKTYAILGRSEEDSRIFHVQCLNKSPSRVFENLLDEPSFGLIQKLKKDPYTATMVGFSKVTNYIFDTLRGPDPLAQQRPPQEMADFLSDTIPHLKMNQQEEPGFEMITQIDVGQRMNVQRREPVSQAEWADSMDAEGRIVNIEQMKQALFKGGVCHALRKEVWKFLLNYFPWDSTKKERLQIHETKTDEYFRMKLQWKSVSAEQEERNSRLRDCRSLIEKDVNRTDRTNKFYEGQDNPSLIMLHDILMTYFMYDFDLGYIQGMSDLLSPILYVMENEVDAFWCFVSYMEQMHQNFEEQMQGLKLQLIQLSTLLRLLDSGFCSYLESQDSGYLYFCFRWLLIRFKREFSFNDILRLWEKQDVASADLNATIIFFNISLLRVTIRSNYESFDYKWKQNYPFMPTVSSPWASMVMWTGLPCKNFHLIICCAILESEKPLIMDQQYGFNEILKHINELSMKLDVNDVLSKAEAICLQMMKCKELPQAVCEVLGLNSSNSTTKEMEMSGKENISQKTSQNSVQQDVLVSPHSASGQSSNRTTNSTSFTK